jgi:hypothetical protein
MIFSGRVLFLLILIPITLQKLACWETEEFDIEEHCRQCRKADHSHLDRNPICETSGFIEQVKCKNTKETVYRACAKLPKYQTQLFWKFEFFVFAIGACSAYFTFYRMKHLDNEHDERIKKQLSSL